MAQYQSDWIVEMLVRARDDGIDRVEAKQEVEEDWVQKVHQAWNVSGADSIALLSALKGANRRRQG